MDSFSTSENQFDYNNLLQMTDNTLSHHHHLHHQNKETLIFEPLNVDFVTNTDIYSASTQQNFDPNQANSVQIFDSNSEQYYNNASLANTKTYLNNNNNNNNYSQNWNYNNSNFGVYQPIDHKLTMMTSVTDYNQQSFNNNTNYDHSIIHQQQQQQQQQQSAKPIFYENNNFNQIIKSETFQNFSNYDNYHSYHDPYHSSANDLVNNSSLSSTPTTSSSNNSSPTNNSITKLELLTHNDLQSQLKTEPFVNVNDYNNNNNVKTEFNQIPTPTTTPPTPTTLNEKYFNNEHFFKTEPPQIKQTEKRKLSLTDIKYSVCNVCDDTPPPGNANFTNETCEACRVFFRRFSKTSKKISRQANCNRACVIKRETRGDCLSCRYDKCLAVGMSSTQNEIEYLNNESSLLQKMPIKQMKIESTNDDLNLNSASINEIRNLSIEVVLSSSSSVAASAATPNSLSSTSSSSSSSSSNSCSSFSDSYTDLIRTLFKEIELKKNQIRSENNEHKMKLHLVDLSEKISNCVVNSLKKSSSNREAFLTLISNCTKQYLNDFKNENKQLLIAYQCLIDNETSFHLATSELRLKSMLNKIYSNLDNRNANLGGNKKSSTEFVDSYAGDYPINYGITLTSNYSNLTAEELQAQAFQSKMFTSLTELKVLHFLLLLFSSFQSLDEFIQYDLDLYNNNNNNNKKNKINSSSSTTTTTIKTDIAYCQRFLVKLIDRLCHDKIIKTQILLSVSEIDFF